MKHIFLVRDESGVVVLAASPTLWGNFEVEHCEIKAFQWAADFCSFNFCYHERKNVAHRLARQTVGMSDEVWLEGGFPSGLY